MPRCSGRIPTTYPIQFSRCFVANAECPVGRTTLFDEAAGLFFPMTYPEKLRDPRWQKKRLEILNRDGWSCQICFDTASTLHVHHRRYLPKCEPWDVPGSALVTLCEECHKSETEHLKDARDLLMAVFSDRYFSGDLFGIADGLVRWKSGHPPDIEATAIMAMMLSPRLTKSFMDSYFAFLKSADLAPKEVVST